MEAPRHTEGDPPWPPQLVICPPPIGRVAAVVAASLAALTAVALVLAQQRPGKGARHAARRHRFYMSRPAPARLADRGADRRRDDLGDLDWTGRWALDVVSPRVRPGESAV